MNSPRISIVTCVYKQTPAWLAAAARSIMAINVDWEWIIVDDGSPTTFAREHLSTIGEICPPMKYRYTILDQNAGLSIARNVGLEMATGEWIVVVDSDDEVCVGLGTSIEDADASVNVLAFESEYFSDDEGWCEHRKIAWFENEYREHAGTTLDPFLWFDFYYHGIVARRSILKRIGGYNETLRFGEDQDILLRTTETSGVRGVGFVHDIGYRYRCNPNGVCAARWSEVEAGYTATMADAARRRSEHINGCRHAGSIPFDGVEVDQYEYLANPCGWVNWWQWRRWVTGATTCSRES